MRTSTRSASHAIFWLKASPGFNHDEGAALSALLALMLSTNVVSEMSVTMIGRKPFLAFSPKEWPLPTHALLYPRNR